MKTVTLWLFVINLGIAFGAGMYEHRVVMPRWLRTSAESGSHWHAAAAREDDTGRRFWVMVSTVPLTLLTIANIYCGWYASGSLRAWWLAAALAAVAERAFTFSYFIPSMIGLMKVADSPEAVAVATRWAYLNNVRHAIVLVAWLAALRAFAIFHQQSK